MVRSASDDFQTTEARYMDPRTSEHEPVLRLLLLFKLHAYIDVDLTSIVNMFIRDTGLNDPIVYAFRMQRYRRRNSTKELSVSETTISAVLTAVN